MLRLTTQATLVVETRSEKNLWGIPFFVFRISAGRTHIAALRTSISQPELLCQTG